MIVTAMEFITLTTGGTSIARRADLDKETMVIARDLINGASHPDGWTVDITASHSTSHTWSISVHGEEVVYCLLCADQRVDSRLWEIAEGLAPARTVLHRPRGVPWLAVAISPVILTLPQELQLALPWLETAVAWTLLEGPVA